MIQGSLARPTRNGRTAACPRCGVVREVHQSKGRSSARLCRDCVGALTPKERLEWAA